MLREEIYLSCQEKRTRDLERRCLPGAATCAVFYGNAGMRKGPQFIYT